MPTTVWILLIVGLLCLFLPGLLVSKRKGEVQQRKNIRRIRNCGWLGIIAAGLLFLSSMISGQGFLGGVPDVEDIAVKVNRHFPRMVNEDTRIDGVTAGDNQLIYHCTLINHRAADIDQIAFTQYMENDVRANILNDNNARQFLENGISLRIDYYSADDFLLASIELPANSQDDQEQSGSDLD
jgi:hypothetical protein